MKGRKDADPEISRGTAETPGTGRCFQMQMMVTGEWDRCRGVWSLTVASNRQRVDNMNQKQEGQQNKNVKHEESRHQRVLGGSLSPG